MKVRREIDCQHRVPAVLGKIIHRRRVLDAGVVDQDVDPAKLACRDRHHVADLLGPRHVSAAERDLDVELGGECFALSLDLRRVAEAVEQNVRTMIGECLRDSQPDAAGRAGHDGRLSVQHAFLLSIVALEAAHHG